MWRVAEKKSPICALSLTVRNLFWGIIKKIKYRIYVKEDNSYVTL